MERYCSVFIALLAVSMERSEHTSNSTMFSAGIRSFVVDSQAMILVGLVFSLLASVKV